MKIETKMSWSAVRSAALGVLASMLALVAPMDSRADVVDDWFDQSTTTSPGSLKTQQRGYYTGGSFQARWRMTNDYPVSVSSPRFSAGCGGIDLFGGGFTYMDPEYLVQKLERAIQAAPAIAFSMAMSEYCKVCQTTMESMEQITDYLNSIQLNDCRMAKGIAAIPAKGDFSIFKDAQEKAMQGYAIAQGLAKNAQGVDDSVRSSGGKAPVDTTELVSECPTVFKTVFTNGSVVKNVAELVSLGTYSDLMRGMIGDVHVSYDSVYKNYKVESVPACRGNDPVDGFDLLTGKLEKKAVGAGGACSVATSSSVADQITDRLQSIADKLRATGAGGGALSAEDMAFINAAPFSVLNVLRDAVKENYVDEAIANSRDVLAAAYAFHMLDDIHNMSRLVLSKADEVSNNARTSTGNNNKCDAEFLRPAFEAIRLMDERALRYREIAKANYSKYQLELNANMAYAKFLQDRRQHSLSNNSSLMR